MSYNSFNPSELENILKEEQQRMVKLAESSSKYYNQQANAIFETHDILNKMQEDSKKDAIMQRKRFIAQTVLSVAALIAAVVAAVAAVIPLLSS